MPCRRTPHRTALRAAALAALALGAGAGPAAAIGAGETALLGAVPMPDGALAAGDTADGSGIALSHDGRHVAFASGADVLGGGGDPDLDQVFRKDRVTGEVVLVSRASGGAGAPADRDGRTPSISADGTRVAWTTTAALDPADVDEAADVYVRDLTGGTTILATPGTSAPVMSDHDLSRDGRALAFATTERLLPDDGNGAADVYVRDLAADALVLVSQRRATGEAASGSSSEPAFSPDGAYVAFSSSAADLTPGFVDGNGSGRDVWVRHLASANQTLVSQRSGQANAGGNATSDDPRVASPGPAALVVAYESQATDVAAPGTDASGTTSVYRRLLALPTSALVSRASGATGANADRTARLLGLSADGSRVAFETRSPALGAPVGSADDVYVRAYPAETTTRMSTDAPGDTDEGAIAGDGTLVAWTESGGVTPDSDPDLAGVFARPTAGGEVAYVSRPAGSAPLLSPVVRDVETSGPQAASADGRWVLVSGRSARLPGFVAETSQVYRLDTATGAFDLVSRADGRDGAASATGAFHASISADGQRVAFVSSDPLAAGDAADGESSVFVRDLAAGTTTLASRADGPDGASLSSYDAPRIAPGGGHVAFAAVGADNVQHVHLRDLASGRTTLVDRADGADGAPGNAPASWPSVSADGRLVAFASLATQLDPADPDSAVDVFVRDLAADDTALVSRRGGLDGQKGAGDSFSPALSADGRVVAFVAEDEQLAPEAGPWNGRTQVVARELATGANRLASRAAGDGGPADANAFDPALSADGGVVAFATSATNLLAGHGADGTTSTFARRSSGELLAAPRPGASGSGKGLGAYLPSLSGDGRCMTYVAGGHTAASGPAGDLWTTYGHALGDGCFARAATTPPTPPPPPRGPEGGATAPRLTGASLLRRRFRVGAAATAAAAARRGARRPRRGAARPAPAGTAFRFRLDARATVTIALERRAAGRRVGRACRPATRRLRRRPACARWVAAGTLTRRDLAAGGRSVAFSGRIGRRALAPGAYRATLVARNAGGSSVPARLSFAVVPGAPARARRPARKPARRTPGRALAAAAGAGSAPLARAAARRRGRGHRLRLTATADPNVPLGRTAKVLFAVTGAVKGRGYRLLMEQESGQRPFGTDANGRYVQLCTPLGEINPLKARRNGRLAWPAQPLATVEENGGYDQVGAEPCRGRYSGELREEVGGGRGRIVSVRFSLAVPSLALRVTANES